VVCDGGGDDRPEVDAESGDFDFAEDPAITGRAAALAAFCPTGAAAGAARGRNAKYICGFENVVVVKSINQGTHVQSNSAKTGPASSIPLTSYYAIYMMVKLTLNLLPIDGLYNGARGVIMGIIFGENGYQRCAAGATAEVNMPIVVG
jgi:hypothetical protein